MSLLVSFILVLAALVIGEIISTKTKAIIPSVFITAVLFWDIGQYFQQISLLRQDFPQI